MKLLFERSAVQNTRTVDEEETFTMLQMCYNMNALFISVINRNMYCEEQFNSLKGYVKRELQNQANTSKQVTKIAEAIQSAGGAKSGGGGNKPVSGYTAIR